MFVTLKGNIKDFMSHRDEQMLSLFVFFFSRCFLWHRRSQSQSFVNHCVTQWFCKQRHMRHFVLLAICTSIKLDKPHWYPLAERSRAAGAAWRPALLIAPCRPAGWPTGVRDTQDQATWLHTGPAEGPMSKKFNPYQLRRCHARHSPYRKWVTA